MARLPRLKGKELIRILEGFGFEVIRIKGSHHSLRHEDGRYTVVPVHSGEMIGPGLLLKILKDAELTRADLE
jgi:predicted RNA binding protein YcfA (HicA-like mRNA interferase family)